MSGGSSPRNQTVTNVTEYPAWLQGPMQDNIQRANALADQMGEQGYQSYNPADRISGFNDLQLNAMQNTRDSVGNWSPLFQRGVDSNSQAASLASQVASRPMGDYTANAAYAGPSAMVRSGSLAGSDLSAYMNPYQQAVTQTALGNLEDARQVQNINNADAAAKAKAFGGSRHGVVEAQTNAAFGKQAGELALNSAQQNFLNAQSMANQDISRNLQAQGMNQQSINQMNQFNAGLGQQANLQNAQLGMQGDLALRGIGLDAAQQLRQGAGLDSELASRYQGMNSNDLNNLLTAGNLMQDQDQMNRDFAYQEFLNSRNFPIDLLNMRYGAVTNTPYQPGSTTSRPMYRDRTQGFLGGAVAGYGASGQSPWGAAIGGLLGAYG